jgi:hypothetical protein
VSRHRRHGGRAGVAPGARLELEKTIAGQVITALRTIGCDVSSTQQTRASRQTEGMPDLFASHAAWGVFAWLEVKRPGERLSTVQRRWHEQAHAAGVHVLVVTSAADALEQFGRLPRRRRIALAEGA